MLGFVENAILWTLALYGLFEIIKTIIYFYTYKIKNTDGIKIIIATKNQEENIEGIMRLLIFKIIYGKEDLIKEIILTDLNSYDKTKDILIRLSEEYECVKYMDLTDLENNIITNQGG